MLKVQQLNNNRWRVIQTNPLISLFNTFPHPIVAAILWRSFQTEAEAQAFADEVAA